MAKNTQFFSKSGKSDVVAGIIEGGQQINALSKRSQDETKPSTMIRKLQGVIKNSSDKTIVEHAEKAVEQLQKIVDDHPLTDKEKTEILKKISKS